MSFDSHLLLANLSFSLTYNRRVVFRCFCCFAKKKKKKIFRNFSIRKKIKFFLYIYFYISLKTFVLSIISFFFIIPASKCLL